MSKMDCRYSMRAAKSAAFVFVCFALTCAAAICVSTRSAVAAPQQAEGGGVVLSSKGSPKNRLPATNGVVELPPVTIAGSERKVTIDLSAIQPPLKSGETFEIELLTKEGKGYAGELADFYQLADKLCFVATLSSDLGIAQKCPGASATQVVERWRTAMNYLGEIARGVTPDKKSAASYAAFVRANPGAVYLIVNGRGVVPTKVRDLQGILTATTPMAKPLAIEFEGCPVPKVSTGQKLSEVCHSSLPLPPVEATLSDKQDKLVLLRQTEQQESVLVRIAPQKEKKGKRVRPAAKGTFEVVIPVELAKASKETTASTETTPSTAGSATSTTDVTTTSNTSSYSSNYSSTGDTENSTDTTSTTEGTPASLDSTTVTEDTTTTSASSEPEFTPRCGGTNTLKAWTKIDGNERTYVGWACKPLSEYNGCIVNSSTGRCAEVFQKMSQCKTFCEEYPKRLAEYEKNKAAATKACAGLIKEKVQNSPRVAGTCPGEEVCPSGTERCENPKGWGSFEISIPDEAVRWDPPSRDEWNECFTYFCDPMPFEQITYTWECSGCRTPTPTPEPTPLPTKAPTEDTTSTTEVTTTSVDSSQSSSSSSTGDTGNPTDTTSTTEDTTTSPETTVVMEETTTTEGTTTSLETTTVTEDPTTITGIAMASDDSSESSSYSLTGDNGNSTETTSTTEVTTTSLETTTVTEDTTTTEDNPDCYVCIYDKFDEDLKKECEFLANKAREQGKTAIVVNQFEALDRRKELCTCENIDVKAEVHGAPGDEAEPFTEIKEILEVAPTCSSITFENMRCSGFDSADKALAHAKELSHAMAKSGFGGTVTVHGYQTINTSPLESLIAELKAESLNDAGPLKQIMLRMRIAKEVGESNRVCSDTNTPLGFQVCAQDVKLLLYECKTAGQVSQLDKAASATTTIVCQMNGKRANQSCDYIPLREVKDESIRQGFKLRGFNEDGCDNSREVCLCKWKEAEVCSNPGEPDRK